MTCKIFFCTILYTIRGIYMPSKGLLQRLLGFLQFGGIILLLACTKYEPVPHSAHCKTLLYRPRYESAASGRKLRPLLPKQLLLFLIWDKVGSLQDIAVKN